MRASPVSSPGRRSGDLLPLEEATERLRPLARRYLGLRPVPVGQIVGTDSRGRDFDREFHPRRPDIRERVQRVERAFPNGDFPPIVVYQFGDAYFVRPPSSGERPQAGHGDDRRGDHGA